MYTFSSKLKTFSFILMVIGILGIGFGFYNAPKNIEEVEKILASESHGEHHSEAAKTTEEEIVPAKHEVETAKEIDTIASDSLAPVDSTKIDEVVPAKKVVEEKEVSKEEEVAAHKDHLEHVLHQLQNKPWAALYVACIFFMLI